MTMSNQETAILIESVYKTYKLYSNKLDQLRDLLGRKAKHPVSEFHALKDINFNIKKGQRLAIVGRNGAGKTTLLKLITGNFRPSKGRLHVNGKIQALMNVGLGFHHEFSGYENIKASLMYNGLTAKEINHAIDDIVDFVELGDFINQPVKTYSLGMQSRLSFATATAIKPEILIIDEVLGAGDAYFGAKSADRMKQLTQGGCTLLLVSHAISQVLQFCEDAIWLECGEIVKTGSALEVVKSYEAYTKKLEFEYNNKTLAESKHVTQSRWLRDKLLKEVLQIQTGLDLQEPSSLGTKGSIHTDALIGDKQSGKKKSVSRWPSHDDSLHITDLRLLDKDDQEASILHTHDYCAIEFEVTAKKLGVYPCTYVVVIFTEDGRLVTRWVSEVCQLDCTQESKKIARLVLEDLLLGNGKYIFSVAIYKDLNLQDQSMAEYYDLLSRSFEFQVISQFHDDGSLVIHPCRWDIAEISKQCNNYPYNRGDSINVNMS